MSLTLASYVPLACVTESPYVENTFMDVKQFRLLHAALGVVTETAELGQRMTTPFGARCLSRDHIQNLKEELGDVMWYVAIGLDVIAHPPLVELSMTATLPAMVEAKAYDDLVVYAGDLADVAKRSIYYRKPLDLERSASVLLQLVLRVRVLTSFVGLQFGDVLAGNIAKLKARYGDKFDAFLATNRNLEAEMKALG